MKFNTLTTRILAGLVLGLGLGAALAAANPAWRADAVAWADGLGNVWLDALRMTIIPLVFLPAGDRRRPGGRHGAGGRHRRQGAAGVRRPAAAIRHDRRPRLRHDRRPRHPRLCSASGPPPSAAVAALRASAHGGAAAVPPSPPIADWLRSFVPANPIKAAAEGSMASIVVFALMFGLAAAQQNEPRRAALFGFFGRHPGGDDDHRRLGAVGRAGRRVPALADGRGAAGAERGGAAGRIRGRGLDHVPAGRRRWAW
ncbi:MAG: cation:dicarboxylase symporter family transporter [Caulobacteraceae bacterium]